MSQHRDEALSELQTRRTIEFADTDMGGIVHFSRFFVFMETAEHEFLAALGAQVHMEWQGHTIGWPRVESSCQFFSPARFGDVLDIHIRVVRKGEKSMTYAITFSAGDRVVARGRISSVCCILDDPDGLTAIPIPNFLAERIAGSDEF